MTPCVSGPCPPIDAGPWGGIPLDLWPGDWWLCRSAPRAEKELAAVCARRGVPRFLPLSRVSRWKRRGPGLPQRRIEAALPLFPGYLFACLPPADWQTLYYRVSEAGACVEMIAIRDQSMARRDVAGLAAAAAADPYLKLGEFAPGAAVVIAAGPFRGMVGHVEINGPRAFVTLRISILGDSVSAEVPREYVEPL